MNRGLSYLLPCKIFMLHHIRNHVVYLSEMFHNGTGLILQLSERLRVTYKNYVPITDILTPLRYQNHAEI